MPTSPRNPFSVNVPNVFESLMAGEQGFKDARAYGKEQQTAAVREQVAKDLMNGGDQQSAIAKLMGFGLVQDAQTIASMQNNTADRQWRREQATQAQANSDRSFGFQKSQAGVAQANSDRSYGLQQQVANRRETTEIERRATAGGLTPGTPEYQEYILRGGRNADVAPSIAEKKEIWKSEDAIPVLDNTISTLERAKELNDKTFTGYTAGIRGDFGAKAPGVASMVGINLEDAEATNEWGNLMSMEAIKTMADTLKGATTDFELNTFVRKLADLSTPPKVRAGIIDRMITLSKRQREIAGSRSKDLRGGTYFKPGGGAPAQVRSIPATLLKEAKDAIAAGRDPEGVKAKLKASGFDTSGL